MRKRSIVLLSGGLDSTVALACALEESEVVLCLTFDYGQRARQREMEAAARIAAYYGLAHEVVELPFLARLTTTALVNTDQQVPMVAETELAGEAAAVSARAVWVPNRNGLFINIAACYAESRGCSLIVTGFNREEAATFPDNSAEFVSAINSALLFSAPAGVKVVSYTQNLDKEEIVALGQRLGVPLSLIWSCYLGGEKPCGSCESCRRLERALRTVVKERS